MKTPSDTLDRRGVIWGVVAVAIALVLVVLGSVGLRWFDAALVGYLFGTLFASSASPIAMQCGYDGRRPRCCASVAGRHCDFIDRGTTVQTVPMVCMHCEDPTCAEVCPADAIKQNEDGIVQSALKPRCIACSNCVYACPFGIPKLMTELDQMMKCDHCYDRTSIGLAPMCASVCPSQALWFGTPDEFSRHPDRIARRHVRVRHPGREDEGATVVREPGPVTIALGRTSTHWLDDPFGLDDAGGATGDGRFPSTHRSGAATSRTPPPARTTSPAGSSCATSCSPRAPSRPAPSAVAAWSSLRPINHGEPRPIVELDDVPVNGTHLFGYPTKDDPAILVRLPGDQLHAMSQKCTHLSCVVYYEADEPAHGVSRATRACSTHARARCWRAPAAAARTYRRRGARRNRLGARSAAVNRPAGRGRAVSSAVGVYVLVLARAPGVPAHRRGRRAAGR